MASGDVSGGAVCSAGADRETTSNPVKRWLLLEIGCLECGYPTEVRGTFDTPEEAKEACRPDRAHIRSEMDDEHYGDWHGDVLFVVYDLTR